MTLPIGNNKASLKRLKSTGGFSFIEVMVTLAILSFGIVLIYQSFFISLDYVTHVSNRLYAMTLLDNKIALTQKILESTGKVPFGQEQQSTTATIHNRKVLFSYAIHVAAIGALKNIYQLTVVVSWPERGRIIRVSRSAYISNYERTR